MVALGALLALGTRAGARRGVGLAGMVGDDLDALAGDAFDGAQLVLLVRGAQRHGGAVHAVAAGAADAVDVALRLVGQVVVDDHADARHVDAARGDVGGDQNAHGAVAEAAQRALARVLRLVAVDDVGGEAVLLEPARDLVGAVLGAGEDDDRGDRLIGQDAGEHAALLLRAGEDQTLRDFGHHGSLRRHGDANGIAHQAHGELLDLLGHGRREQRRLALRMRGLRQALDVVDEAHVEHAVGLVEDEEARLVQLHVALAHEVDQPAGRGDEEIDAVAQALDLAEARHAAEHQRGGDMRALGQFPDRVIDLDGEFAGGSEDEGVGGSGRAAGAHGHDLGEDGQREGRRLAGAGLGDAQHVAPGQVRRDRLLLDRLGRGEAGSFGCLEEEAGDSEFLETVHGLNVYMHIQNYLLSAAACRASVHHGAQPVRIVSFRERQGGGPDGPRAAALSCPQASCRRGTFAARRMSEREKTDATEALWGRAGHAGPSAYGTAYGRNRPQTQVGSCCSAK